MMLGKSVTLDLFKVKVFWNKAYGVIFSVHDVTKNCHVTQIRYDHVTKVS